LPRSTHPTARREAALSLPLLVARAQLGDLRALDELLATVQEPLYRHICILLGDEHAAEDVLQETLLTISRKLGTLREPRWFRAWAFRIATRHGVRHARRARRQPDVVDPRDLADVPVADESVPFDPDILAELVDILPSVPPASQIVLRMHYLEGLTHVEIAEVLEISVGTVKSRLSYGLGWLRRVVKRS
jgi:RNA polymerase sigma-70 factor (ECF subfamily)